MIEGVDYSGTRPSAAALLAAGRKFVVRYVPYGGYAKGLTAAEAKDLLSHGISVALVFESIAKRALGGVLTGPDIEYAQAHHLHTPSSVTPYAAGQADAWKSQVQLAGLGLSTSMPIYFAVDFDATPAQQAAIDEYLRGAASIIGAARVGVYGGYWVVLRCKANGSARWFWQTYAWSGGNVLPGVHILQYQNHVLLGGVWVDLNRAFPVDFGQTPRPTSDVFVRHEVVVSKGVRNCVFRVARFTHALSGAMCTTWPHASAAWVKHGAAGFWLVTKGFGATDHYYVYGKSGPFAVRARYRRADGTEYTKPVNPAS